MKHLIDQPGGDQESLHQTNLSTVLTHLSQNTPISRSSLTEIAGLKRTITRLVRKLIEQGLEHETGF